MSTSGTNQLILDLWAHRRLAALVTVVTVGLMTSAAVMTPEKYQATIVVSPVSRDPQGMGGLGGLASQLSGLTSLAGLSISPSTDRVEAIAALESMALLRQFIEENNLLPVIFENRWDASTGTWKVSRFRRQPTLWAGADYLHRRVRAVTERRATGLVTLSITWKDPVLAAQWANDLVAMTNDYLRSRAINESEKNIEYLRKQASLTNIVELQRAIYTLMETEIRNAMLARGTDEYGLRVIDRATAPERPVSPRILLWIAAGFVGGLVISMTLILLLSARPDD